jgi:ribokinase
MSGKIVVIGSANVDFVMQMERLPRRGESVANARFSQLFGGKGANQAVAAARAGAETSFVGCVGGDVLGRMMKEHLRAAGVNIDHLCEREDVASGAALIMVDREGGNILAIAPGANRYVGPETIRALEGLISGAAMVMLQYEIPVESLYAAIDLAAECGAQTMLNLAPAGPFDEARLGRVSYLVVNETEAESLCGFPVTTDARVSQAAEWMLARGVGTAIITLGSDGAYLASRETRERTHAFPVSPVDTTAAGDTFCGALAAALVEGKPLAEAARFASAAAAVCVTRLGAQISIPTRVEIEALLARA